MRKRRSYRLIIITICVLLLGSCTTYMAGDQQQLSTSTAAESPKLEITISSTPTSYYIVATVWQDNPNVPVLVYHEFKTNRPSTYSKVSRIDFEEELESLYQSNYVTISLERWLDGDTRVPEGKRPVILSMDDLFFRNQITLTSDGNLAKDTGLGVSWEFSQSHPEFGFHWALFSNLGDRPYGEGNQAQQQIQLANAIVWCIEHDAMVYNHTFRHVNLRNTNGLGITAELRANDKYLRELLRLVNREDLIPKLRNIVALPGGRIPRWEDSQTALNGYIDPDGRKIEAIFNIDYITRPDFLAAPYAKSFNSSNLPRTVANIAAIDYLVENRTKYPTARSCNIGPLDESQSNDANYLAEKILGVVKNGLCPQGVFVTQRFVFSASNEKVQLIQKVKGISQQ